MSSSLFVNLDFTLLAFCIFSCDMSRMTVLRVNVLSLGLMTDFAIPFHTEQTKRGGGGGGEERGGGGGGGGEGRGGRGGGGVGVGGGGGGGGWGWGGRGGV